MAKIKFGSIITDSRGSIGGHSLKWSRYGNTAITKPQPPKTRTAAQSLQRTRFSSLSKNWWQTLTPAQRTAWRDLAAANPRPNVWGDDFPITGLALYISLNCRLLAAGGAVTNTAPSDQFVESVATATLTIAAPSTADLSFSPTPAPTDHVLYISATPPLSPGIAAPSHRFAFLLATATGQTSPLDMSSELLSRFGTILTARQYFLDVSFLNTDNGALSTPVRVSAIAA